MTTLPTLVFLPGEFHGQKNLVDNSPWTQTVRHDWATFTFTFLPVQSHRIWLILSAQLIQAAANQGSLLLSESLGFFLLWSVTWAYTTYTADLSQGSPRSLEGKRQFPCLKPLRDFPGGPVVNSPPANAGDMGSIPALGRFHLPMSS